MTDGCLSLLQDYFHLQEKAGQGSKREASNNLLVFPKPRYLSEPAIHEVWNTAHEGANPFRLVESCQTELLVQHLSGTI